MILWTKHTYQNVLKEGCGNDAGLYHETEEKARLAAKGNEKEYEQIADLLTSHEYRCDPCFEEGIASKAFKHISGKDYCDKHAKELQTA